MLSTKNRREFKLWQICTFESKHKWMDEVSVKCQSDLTTAK